jgi:hypothetical protein
VLGVALAVVNQTDRRLVHIQPDHTDIGTRELYRKWKSDIAETDDGDFHTSNRLLTTDDTDFTNESSGKRSACPTIESLITEYFCLLTSDLCLVTASRWPIEKFRVEISNTFTNDTLHAFAIAPPVF